MRAFGFVAVLAAWLFATPAWAQFTDADGGQRHDATGLICPKDAGGFELKRATGSDQGFICRYAIRCRTEEGCTDAIGYASISWGGNDDYSLQFRSWIGQSHLSLIDEQGPAWAGSPKLFAGGGEGPNLSRAGWWVIQPKGKTLNIGVVYNASAAEGARQFIAATVAINR